MAVEEAPVVTRLPVETLLTLIANGDRAAENEFIRRFQRGVRALVRRRCRHGDPIVEDLVQDVLARVLQRLRAGAVRDVAAFPAYLQTVVVHATSAEYRARRNMESSDALDALVGEKCPAEQADRTEVNAAVHALLRELPVARDRELLLRFYLREESKDEVCDALGIDAAHFHRVVFRARERFRAVLVRAGIEET